MGALQIIFSVCKMFRCFNFLIMTQPGEVELILVSMLWATCTHLKEFLVFIRAEHLERVLTHFILPGWRLASGWYWEKMDIVLCSPGLWLADRWILDTIPSWRGPLGGPNCGNGVWLQTNARLCKSVWPGHHYRGNCQKCCVPLQKNAFLLGRPEEWNWVLLLMLHFDKR